MTLILHFTLNRGNIKSHYNNVILKIQLWCDVIIMVVIIIMFVLLVPTGHARILGLVVFLSCTVTSGSDSSCCWFSN